MSLSRCFHCDLPALKSHAAVISSHLRYFCCSGCLACAQLIEQGGLVDFYQFRDKTNGQVNEKASDFSAYDLPVLRDGTVEMLTDDIARVRFYLPSITCAACVWLIEKYLSAKKEIQRVSVNGTTQNCEIKFDIKAMPLSQLMAELESIGYSPKIATESSREEAYLKNQKSHLLKMGVAGLSMMQIGMVSTALYSGAIQGIDEQWQWFLRWTSLLFAIPVIAYSAQPFFVNAWRAIRLAGVNMDVPVSIALGLAFAASTYATVTNSGEVYFDSVSMFTFFLLLGRYIEKRIRFKNMQESLRLFNLLPVAVKKRDAGKFITAALSQVKTDDILWVGAGEVIPCDGRVVEGASTADESLLTGESTAQVKHIGSHVIAGSINGDSAMCIAVDAVGGDTRLAGIEKIAEQAEYSKPAQVLMADKLSGYFVFALLVIALLLYVIWWTIDPSKALWVVLSVLVVTCPCALSLATPAAIGASVGALRRLGLLVKNASMLEAIDQTDIVVFDKTGTLTQGKYSLDSVEIQHESFSKSAVIDIVAALERYSHHPIAQAFKHYPVAVEANHVEVLQSQGVVGMIQGVKYSFGKASLAAQQFQLKAANIPSTNDTQADSTTSHLCLASSSGVIAWFALSDRIRPSAFELIASLKKRGITPAIFSGDTQKNVAYVSNRLGIEYFMGQLTAQQKLSEVKNLQTDGRRVAMVGDGINDAPVLSCADVSIAMHQGSDLTKSKSDAVIVSNDLNILDVTLRVASRTKKIIRQNFAWALGYNIIALPLAGAGFVPPYIAAIGMSLSSLVVVLNSLRLNRGASSQ